jgi:hypothetical protein
MDSSFPNILDLLLKALQNFIASNLFTIILVFLFLIIVWLLIRELLTWYWKINKIVSILEKIEIGIDFLATNADQNNKEREKNGASFIEKPIEEVKSQRPDK